MLDRQAAEDYASWFRCLADPTRIQILHLLAASGGPMTVGEIVRQVGVGQSTVSHHLKVLTQVRFVTVEHAGTSSRYQVNPAAWPLSRLPPTSSWGGYRPSSFCEPDRSGCPVPDRAALLRLSVP
jgi:DNA-binding transcriptional ArsR family regulator